MTSIFTALCLPAPDVEALCLGRTILAMPRIFINPGREFALYPGDIAFNALPPEQYYQTSFIPTLNSVLNSQNPDKAIIKAWAKCELCQILDEAEYFKELSQLTVWTEEALYKTLAQRGRIFLTYLRVYHLPESLEIPVNNSSRFVSLPKNVAIANPTPILNNTAYEQRYRLTVNRQTPPYLELVELENAIAQFLTQNLTPQEKIAAISLKQDLHQILGLSTECYNLSNPKLDWINTITQLGTRSQEEEGKSNYQAGTDFENIVKQSLEFLGFKIDQTHKGGAGGLDFFCSEPYLLVGECKAGRKIPNETAVQLLNLGTLRLNDEIKLKQITKLIIGPGQPTSQLAQAANVHNMAILHPQSLEKLVKLQSQHPGSVDLFELRDYLKAGQADAEVEKYIKQVLEKLKLRSHIVQVVKDCLEKANIQSANGEKLHTAYLYSNSSSQRLTEKQLHEILIELSSPLAGYLGRIKNPDGSDRFYFIRQLTVIEL